MVDEQLMTSGSVHITVSERYWVPHLKDAPVLS